VAVDAFQHCLLGFKAFALASALGGAGASFFAFRVILAKSLKFFLTVMVHLLTQIYSTSIYRTPAVCWML
jgi:hypothetical protein